ncbi:MAG: FAD-binding oxidoreductase [Cyanobacteriota bacterium]
MSLSPHLAAFLASQPHPPKIETPSTVAELAELLKEYSRNRGEQTLWVAGNGSKLSWGNPTGSVDLLVSTRGLHRLIDHAAADLTVTVEAGMTLAELQQILAEKRQWWPVDPLYPDWATLGGILATADTGSLRQRYGGIRDLILGITFVRADGEVAKAGGRVVKNVAGYDLMKLFTGSLGSLGIVTQVSLRLYPLPAAQGCLKGTGSLMALEEFCQQLLRAKVSPVGLDLGLDEGEPYVAILFHGSERVIAEQMAQTRFLGEALHWQEEVKEGLAATTEVGRGLMTLQPSSTRSETVLMKFGCLPNRSLGVLQQFQALFPGCWVQLHRGCGLGRAWVANPEEGCLERLQQHLKSAGGFLTLLEAPPPLKAALASDLGPAGFLMDKLRQQFDPARTLGLRLPWVSSDSLQSPEASR